MTIKYFRNEHKEITHITFIPDGIVQEIISDGFSYIYMKRMSNSFDEKRYIRNITNQYNMLPFQEREAKDYFYVIKNHIISKDVDEFTASDYTRPRFLNWIMSHYKKKDLVSRLW
jgi:hypothetical protein